ncbi:uncharacterized protein EV422DRAFT_620499 [Fimicolochytrium jonesii]|uniref:uncharacterized protein n=1 Tax=Fimicolochytrium jonesii TaxID=1396493 RepID=UPI0022FE0A7A|nr:uncharacterized protein EV422DRAFT_620499 [Fimicolochytrium jonesii]KAI8820096.1 hypothetical protein EV422DRAFT_620499 [Fimicolochytrium jonesii]
MAPTAIPPKFVSAQADINAYRWKGQWPLAEQRTKRKCAKYHQAGSSFENLVVGESLLNQTLRSFFTHDVHADNGLGNQFIVNLFPEDRREPARKAAHGAVNYLQLAADKADEAAKGTLAGASYVAVFEKQQAYTLIAWLDVHCGQAAEAVQKLRWFDFAEAETAPLDTEAYTKVMLLAGLTVKAMALHLSGDDNGALQLAKRAMTFYVKHEQTKAPVPRRPRYTYQPDADQWQRWFEISHHFHALLAAKLGHLDDSLASCRRYMRLLLNTPDTFQPLAKVAVLGIYLRLLAKVPINSGPPLLLAGVPQRRVPSTIPSEVRAEMRQMLMIYERLLTTVLPFPRGEDVKPLEIERHQRVEECYDWHVFVETYTMHDESLGDTADRHYRLIESLYRGTKHTFQSMRVLRYMSHTFTSLVNLFGDNMPADEKIEGEAALESYVFYWDKQYKASLKQHRKNREDGSTPRESLAELSPLIKTLSEMNHMGAEPPSTTRVTAVTRVLMDHPEEPGVRVTPPTPVENGARTPTTAAESSAPAPVENGVSGPARSTTPPPSTTNGNLLHSSRLEENEMGIETIGGERLVDVLGVLFAGVRMLSHNVEGQEDKACLEADSFPCFWGGEWMLRRAVGYAERAVRLVEKHGRSCGPELPELKHLAYRYLGVTYGELAQEVRDIQERRDIRKRALTATEKATELNPKAWEGMYQRGLQLAEAGEITLAITHTRTALTLNPTHAPSYNLLALLLAADKDYTRAIKACNEGVHACLEHVESPVKESDGALFLKPDQAGRGHEGQGHAVSKEELINLKLTQIVLESHRHGLQHGLKLVRETLHLARRLLGSVDTLDVDVDVRVSKEYEHAPQGSVPPSASAVPGHLQVPAVNGNINGLQSIRSGRSGASSRRSTKKDKLSKASKASATSAVTTASSFILSPNDIYRFRVHDLFICIWLTAAGLYRGLDRFTEALAAVREAEKLAATMAQMDVMLRRLPSRIYQAEGVGMRRTLKEHGRFRRMLSARMHLGRRRGKEEREGEGEVGREIEKWGAVGVNVKRVVADVAFECALIRQSQFNQLNRPLPPPPFPRYVSATAAAEAERQMKAWKRTVDNGGLRPSPSQMSLTTLEEERLAAAAGSGDKAGSTRAAPSIPNGTSLPSPSPSPSSAPTSSTQPPPANPPIFINGLTPTAHSEPFDHPPPPPPTPDSDPLTLDTLLETFSRVADLDDDHLPTRVHLGILYLLKNEVGIAAHYLERACKSSKARGGGGGKMGQGSWYGGASAAWTWMAWRSLSRCHVRRDRAEVAREAVWEAVREQRVCFVRGLECLARMPDLDA